MLGQRVFVAGHRGMVGSAIVRRLRANGVEPLTVDRSALDLRRQEAVEKWVNASRPDIVIVAAAKVGGILANDTFPAEFLHDNLAIQTNLIHAAHLAGVERLVFLGSSCIYPKMAAQPITESSLLTGPLEPTNEWYAIAKIAGLKMCQAYRRQFGRRYVSIMPCNLYGPHDNFDPQNSHVIPAMIRRFDEAKSRGAASVTIWGNGEPLREFLHVDDLAHAVLFCAEHYEGEEPINCGSGEEISIGGLAEMVRQMVGFEGYCTFDRSKPNGTPRKVMNTDRLRTLGWAPTIGLLEGLPTAYAWYRDNIGKLRISGNV